MRKRLKFKKLLNQFRTLSSELDFILENNKEVNWEFEKYYRDYCDRNNIDLLSLEKKNSQKVQGVFKTKSIITEIAEKITIKDHAHKDVYKNIARKLHPDKLPEDDPNRKQMEEDFKKANEAVSLGNWGTLFEIAEKHDVDIKNYDQVNESIIEDIDRVKKEIHKHKNTYGWKLFDCEEEPCRENVVKGFLNYLFNI
mgnify:CR=1 FL=1